MLVLDTSAWIEILLGSKAGITFNERMTEQSVIIVPTTVQLELAKWALREDREQKAQQLGGYTSGFTLMALDTAIASLAALCARDRKLHITDAIIYAIAQIHDAPLLTCDAQF